MLLRSTHFSHPWSDGGAQQWTQECERRDLDNTVLGFLFSFWLLLLLETPTHSILPNFFSSLRLFPSSPPPPQLCCWQASIAHLPASDLWCAARRVWLYLAFEPSFHFLRWHSDAGGAPSPSPRVRSAADRSQDRLYERETTRPPHCLSPYTPPQKLQSPKKTFLSFFLTPANFVLLRGIPS